MNYLVGLTYGDDSTDRYEITDVNLQNKTLSVYVFRYTYVGDNCITCTKSPTVISISEAMRNIELFNPKLFKKVKKKCAEYYI